MPTKCEKCGANIYGKNADCLVCSGQLPTATEIAHPFATPPAAQQFGVTAPPPSQRPPFPMLTKTSGLAIAALVLGLFACIPVVGVVGIILGIIALKQINTSRGQLTGQGMAIAGIICSFVFIIPSFIFCFIVVPRLMYAADRARAATYHANQAEIQSALEQFHYDCGVYPAVLDDLYQTTSTGLNSATTQNHNFSTTNFNAPYLKVNHGISSTVCLPVNPYVDNSVATNKDSDHHWSYSPDNVGAKYTIVGAGANVPPSGL